MHEDEAEETLQDVLRIAAEAGYEPTAAQMERWRGAGLLPTPRLEHAGHRGAVALYPAGTGDQLVALCRWKDYDRRLEVIRWGLWTEGYPVETEDITASMVEALDRFEAYLRELRRAYAAEDPNPIDQSEESGNAVPFLRFLRRAAGPVRFPTFLVALLDIALDGTLSPDNDTGEVWGVLRDGAEALFRKVVGRDDSLMIFRELGPLTSEDVLALTITRLAPLRPAALKRWLEDEVDSELVVAVRDEAQSWYRLWYPKSERAEPLPPSFLLLSVVLGRVGIPFGTAIDFLVKNPDTAVFGNAFMSLAMSQSVKQSRRK